MIVVESANDVESAWDYRVIDSDEVEGILTIQYVMTNFNSSKGAAWSTAGTEEAKIMFSQDRNSWQYAQVGGGVYTRGI